MGWGIRSLADRLALWMGPFQRAVRRGGALCRLSLVHGPRREDLEESRHVRSGPWRPGDDGYRHWVARGPGSGTSLQRTSARGGRRSSMGTRMGYSHPYRVVSGWAPSLPAQKHRVAVG